MYYFLAGVFAGLALGIAAINLGISGCEQQHTDGCVVVLDEALWPLRGLKYQPTT